MKIQLFPFLFSLAYLCACKDAYLPEEHPYSNFPSHIILHAEPVLLDTVLFQNPYRIILKDSILLVLDLQKTDGCCHAFTYPEGRFLASFGNSAPIKLPEDPDAAVLYEKMVYFNSPDSIWLLTENKMELARWRLIASESRVEQIEVIHLDKKLVRVQSFYTTDSCIWVTDYTGKHRYHQVDYSGKCVHSYGRIPTRRYYKDGDSPTVAMGWSHVSGFFPQQDLLVMASRYGETIELYNVREDTFNMLIGPSQYPKFYIRGEEAIPRGIIGFNDVQVSDSYIYAIFEDRQVQELKHARLQGIRAERGGRYIYVFTHGGTPVFKYTLDRAISGFHVDESAECILATDPNGGDAIIKFKVN